MQKDTTVVIIGSGVIGLTVAYILSEHGRYGNIVIVAKEFTEDLDSQGWSSPWAGANWSPLTFDDERGARWETRTLSALHIPLHELSEKLRSLIPQGLAMHLPSRVFYPNDDMVPKIWYREAVLDYNVLPPEDVPPGYALGLSFGTVSVHPPTYLTWLRSSITARGVKFVKKRLSSIEQALDVLPEGNSDVIIVNATGLGSRSLIGVQDNAVFPIRGQTILVDAPNVKDSVSGISEDVAYVIPRSDGTAILGGTYNYHSWDLTPNMDVASRILRQCSSLLPALVSAKIISHNVGLRPARQGGARVEKEVIALPLALDPKLLPFVRPHKRRELKVVHAYGIGPAGYQSSWGLAEDVALLVESFLDQ